MIKQTNNHPVIGDVTKMPIIGKIKTKGIFGMPSETLEVVAVLTDEQGVIQTYVLNQWYKEYKKVPKLVPALFVLKYTSKNWRENL